MGKEAQFSGIDIGGTNTRIMSVASLDRPTIVGRDQFFNADEFGTNFKRITDILDQSGTMRSIGIGIPGKLNQDKSIVVQANNIPGYQGAPLKQELTQRYQCPIAMEADTIAAAIGETLYGSGQDTNFAYIVWGTGIAGALASSGGNQVQASRLEWEQYFRPWESACGGRQIQHRYGKPAEQLHEAEWQQVMKAFSTELTHFIATVHPQTIIFGGGIAVKQENRLLDLVSNAAKEHDSMPTIKVTSLREDAGLYGALGLLRNKFYE